MRVRVTISGPNGQADRSPEFNKPEITIGRRPSNDVVIPDAGASGAHARVMVTGGALTILDLDSTNGTIVNREALQGPRLLDPTDIVEIGEFRLQFSLESGHTSVAPMPARGPEPKGSAKAPEGGGAWPAPPPMMDEVEAAAPTAIARAVTDADLDAMPRRAASPVAHERSALFPRLELSVPSAPPPPAPPPSPGRGGYEFQPAPAPILLSRAFRSVWLRKHKALITATAGLREQVTEAIGHALAAAAAATELGDVVRLGARMVEELVADGPVPELLTGNPDEVLIVGATRVRVSRGGHVSEGPSPFTCDAALACWVARVCHAGPDDKRASMRGAFGLYTVRAIHGEAGTVVSLRRASAHGASTLEGLVRSGILSHGIAALLSACVIARLNVLLCAGPGADTQALLAALMACAPPSELQVVLGNPDLKAPAFQSTTVLLTRDALDADAIGSALSLGPDRLGVAELQWNEVAAVSGIVSRSMSHVLGVRATTATAGLNLLESMLSTTAPPAAARQLLMNSIDIVVTTQLFADAVTRVTGLSEPKIEDGGFLRAQDIFALVPGTRTWQFAGVTPRCFEDITRRGFPLDPSVFA